MSGNYKVITSGSEGVYREKGSRFLSFAIPVQTEDEVKTILEQYRKDYFDARHVCYAYMLGEKYDQYRSNDDGEPSGTAGRPILGQINSFQLTNILIIVVRYFGGTLLGTGGLITAYKEAAADAINNAQIVEKKILIPLSIHFSYELMSEVQRLIKEFDLKIKTQKFEIACDMSFSIPEEQFVTVHDRFSNLYGVNILEE